MVCLALTVSWCLQPVGCCLDLCMCILKVLQYVFKRECDICIISCHQGSSVPLIFSKIPWCGQDAGSAHMGGSSPLQRLPTKRKTSESQRGARLGLCETHAREMTRCHTQQYILLYIINAMARVTGRDGNKWHTFIPHSHFGSGGQSVTEAVYYILNIHMSRKWALQSCLGPSSKAISASAPVKNRIRSLSF